MVEYEVYKSIDLYNQSINIFEYFDDGNMNSCVVRNNMSKIMDWTKQPNRNQFTVKKFVIYNG